MATADIGLIGLAVMGSNLALNIAEKGYMVAAHNRTASQDRRFRRDGEGAGPRRQDHPQGRSRGVHPDDQAAALGDHHGQGRQAGRRDDRAAAAAPREGRRHPRMRQLALHRHQPPLRLSRRQGHRLSRHRRLGWRRGRAARPLDHGRRLQGAVAQRRADPRRRSRRSSTARAAAPISAKAGPGTSSRPSTTASNTATCR